MSRVLHPLHFRASCLTGKGPRRHDWISSLCQVHRCSWLSFVPKGAWLTSRLWDVEGRRGSRGLASAGIDPGDQHEEQQDDDDGSSDPCRECWIDRRVQLSVLVHRSIRPQSQPEPGSRLFFGLVKLRLRGLRGFGRGGRSDERFLQCVW